MATGAPLGLKGLAHEAAIGTRAIFDPLIEDWKQEHATPTNEEALQQYVALHRGNPAALQQFVAQHALAGHLPPGMHPIEAMRQYEAWGEGELAKQGYGAGAKTKSFSS
jgi:hypothetical protein